MIVGKGPGRIDSLVVKEQRKPWHNVCEVQGFELRLELEVVEVLAC